MFRFSLFGFPVSVHWMFWLTTAMLGGGLRATSTEDFRHILIWVVACFVSIVFHELGHALAFRHYGGRPQILLYGFGGLASSNIRLTRLQDIIVSLAGPVFSLFLGGCFWILEHLSTNDPISIVWLLRFMIYINFWWTMLNLLPVLPLDGGRVSAAVLGNRRTALILSMTVAGLVAGYFLIMGRTYSGVFFGFMAFQNFKEYQGSAPSWKGPT